MSDLNAKVSATRAILEQVAREYSPAVFASSLAAEDMVWVANFGATCPAFAVSLSEAEAVLDRFEKDAHFYLATRQPAVLPSCGQRKGVTTRARRQGGGGRAAAASANSRRP